MTDFAFIKAAFSQPHSRVPIWIMRQAGRYLPEYREVRSRASFLDLCHTPRLMLEVTRQPITRFDLDAAILFSDILIPLEPLGTTLTFEEGGPRLTPPIREPKQVDALQGYDPADRLTFALEGIRQIREALDDQVPLIGFCGSPFTLLCYLVEGGGSRNFIELKKFLYCYPDAAVKALNLLSDLLGQYLKAQITAGAQAVQLFDTWGGILSLSDYEKYSRPYNRRLFDICHTPGVPRILYLSNTSGYLPLLADLNCEVVSVDWRTDLQLATRILRGKAIQGNLDPTVLLGTPERVISEATGILKTMADQDGFIFNLGHGILPETPVENVRILVETIRNFPG